MRHGTGVRLACVAAVLGLGLAGCGGGGGGGTTSVAGTENGQVVIGLADAEGDFLRYEVAVEAIRLTRSDGLVVDALPQSTRVDFTQLTQLAEFVSVATVPTGTYTGASLLLDYADAVVEVEVGGTAATATLSLPGGNPLVEAAVTFAGGAPLQIHHGSAAHLGLDFDLAKSNAVTVTGSAATVTVQPSLAADVTFTPMMDQRVRGTLQAVDEVAKSFTVALAPFHTSMGTPGAGGHSGPGRPSDGGTGGGHMGPGAGSTGPGMGSGGPGMGSGGPGMGSGGPGMGSGGPMGPGMGGTPTMAGAGRMTAGFAGGEFGQVTVLTDDETAFEIDGLASRGDAGLAALAAEPVGTPVLALVSLEEATQTFVALEVYAGSSVAGVNLDVLTGTVVARSGNTLTVRRGMMEHASGDFQASMDATVVVADSTKVLRQAEGEEVQRTIQEISVGQRISAFGTLSGTTGTYTLDASEGLVRLLVSEAEGLVSELPPGELTLDLQQLGGTSIDRLDFGGTGSTPTAYRVDLGGLSVSGLSVGAPVVVRGFVAPFGAAPPDFEAVSVSW